MATAKKAPLKSTRTHKVTKHPVKVAGSKVTPVAYFMTIAFTALCLTFLIVAIWDYAR